MFQNILLAEYHGTFHDKTSSMMTHLCCLTFKTSLNEQEMMSSICLRTNQCRWFPTWHAVAHQGKTQSFHNSLFFRQKKVLWRWLQKYRDCDPELLEELGREIKMSAEGANRWTDNIYAVQSWIGRKFPSIDVRDLNKQVEMLLNCFPSSRQIS